MPDNTLGPISKEDVAVANSLLEFVSRQATADEEEGYQDVLRRILEPDEYIPYIRSLSGAMELARVNRPVGVFIGSTATAIAESLPEDSGEAGAKAIRMLKSEGRILQAGRGRGKALTVISDEKVSQSDFAFQDSERKTRSTGTSRQAQDRSSSQDRPTSKMTPSKSRELAQRADMALATLNQVFQELLSLVGDIEESRTQVG